MFELKIEDKTNFKEFGYIKIDELSKNNLFSDYINEFKKDLKFAYDTQNIQSLGGYKAGNLNINLGKYGPLIFNLLQSLNFKKYFNFITGDDISNFKVLYGGNLNLVNSKQQLFHTDGKWNPRMIVFNIASMDITSENGPIEIIESSHKFDIPYWKLLLNSSKLKKKKINLKKGEILIREHRLWHRGTTNKSKENREMLGIMFLKITEKNKLIEVKESKIKLYDNMFDTSIRGQFKEFIFVNLKFIIATYRLLISFLK